MVGLLCAFVCMCVSLSVHVYLFAEWVSWFVFQQYLYSLDLCAVQLLQHSVCCVSEYLSSWSLEYGKFTLISPACLPVLGYFISCSCFNQPAGCTVAEGSTRGFTPLGQCPTITSPAAVVTSMLSALNQGNETHNRTSETKGHFTVTNHAMSNTKTQDNCVSVI